MSAAGVTRHHHQYRSQGRNVAAPNVLVVSTRDHARNPELMQPGRNAIPGCACRMLAELMRLKNLLAIAGNPWQDHHDSMVAALLDAGDLDPTVINGGIINAYGPNGPARRREMDCGWKPTRATGKPPAAAGPPRLSPASPLRPQHLSILSRPYEAVQTPFRIFVEKRAFYGFRCDVHRSSRGADHRGKIEDRRIIT